MAKRLLFLNGLAVLGVVLFHASGTTYIAMIPWATRYLPAPPDMLTLTSSISYYLLRLVDQLVVVSIPIFLFVSGYFITVATRRDQATVTWKVVFSRIKYLLIPYLIWSAISILLAYIGGRNITLRYIGVSLLTGSSNEIYYYVPLLIQLYLISPLLVLAARQRWKALLIVTALIQIGVHVLIYSNIIDITAIFSAGNPLTLFLSDLPLIPKWFFPTCIFWFTLGIVYGFNLKEFKDLVSRFRWVIVAGAVFFYLVGFVEWELLYRASGLEWLPHFEAISDSLYSIFVIFAMVGITSIPNRLFNPISDLGIKSYGIFLIHGLVITVVARLIYAFFPQLLGLHLVLFAILVVVGLSAPLLLMNLWDRTPGRKYHTFIFG